MFSKIFSFFKKHKGVLCGISVAVIVVLLLIGYQSWLLIGEYNYVFSEYDVEIPFESAKRLLEEKGYYFTEIGLSQEESVKVFWILHNNDTEKQDWTQLFVCDNVELAKMMYQSALCGTDSNIPELFTQTRTLYRINNCVYFTKNAVHCTEDILNAYGIDSPDPVSVVRCNRIEQNILPVEDLRQSMDVLKYKRYSNLAYDDFGCSLEFVIPPEQNSCFVLFQASEPLSEKQQEEIYKTLMPMTEKDYLGVKMVLIADDTIVMGDAYTIDLLLERVGRSH